jgi:hypothetical protein
MNRPIDPNDDRRVTLPSGRRGTVLTPRQQGILDSFDYHRPAPEQAERIERNRLAFKVCALAVIENCPDGADQTAALRQLHEAMMTANKAIACEPGTPHESPLPTPTGFAAPLPDDPPEGPLPGYGEVALYPSDGIAIDDPNPGV